MNIKSFNIVKKGKYFCEYSYYCLLNHLLYIENAYSNAIFPFKISIFIIVFQTILRISIIPYSNNVYLSILMYNLIVIVNDFGRLNILAITLFSLIILIEKTAYSNNHVLQLVIGYLNNHSDVQSQIWIKCNIKQYLYKRILIVYLILTNSIMTILSLSFVIYIEVHYFMPYFKQFIDITHISKCETIFIFIISSINYLTLCYCLWFFLWRINLWFSLVTLMLRMLADCFNWNFNILKVCYNSNGKRKIYL